MLHGEVSLYKSINVHCAVNLIPAHHLLHFMPSSRTFDYFSIFFIFFQLFFQFFYIIFFDKFIYFVFF